MIKTTNAHEVVTAFFDGIKEELAGDSALNTLVFIEKSELEKGLGEFYGKFYKLPKDERTNVKIWELLTDIFPVND